MSTETHSFQAEVNQVLHLVIHSLYSNKDVFLRELISNASDALDKLRFAALTDPSLTEHDPSLHIRISTDDAAGTITIDDNGIGMTKEELTEHLGTVARSGSRALVEQLKAAQASNAPQLIGQFGVGFYSAFLVADKVEVVSRSARGGGAHRWTSEGKDTFTVDDAEDATYDKARNLVRTQVRGHGVVASPTADGLRLPLDLLRDPSSTPHSIGPRHADVYFATDYTWLDELSVHAPAGWKIASVPAPRRREAPGYVVDLETESHGDRAIVRVRTTTKAGEFPPAAFAGVRAAMDERDAFLYESIALSRK